MTFQLSRPNSGRSTSCSRNPVRPPYFGFGPDFFAEEGEIRGGSFVQVMTPMDGGTGAD